MKWLGYVFGAIAIVAVATFVFLKLVVGAINAPVGDSQFSGERLLTSLKVPDGFSVGLYAEVENARVVRFSPGGHLLVANPNADHVTILDPDFDNDGAADSARILMGGLNGPNGLDFFQDWLYIAETDAIGRVKFDPQTGHLEGDYERIVTDLPAGQNHWKKTLRFGPDGLLYVTMGSSCNACIEKDERRGTMVRYNADGSNEEIIARGLRNSAGFDWSPTDKQLYATDNGRDLLGDDFPPCELNLIVEGAHYGWPYANAANIPDPDYGPGNEAIVQSSTAPVFNFAAHNAPLGIEFVKDSNSELAENFPESYHGAAIVALHGSWNRSEKDGYKVVSLHWNDRGEVISRDFLWGFLNDDVASGRPAEVTQGPDGAFYISDDYANVIYRVAYGEAERNKTGLVVSDAPKFSATTTLAALSDEELKESNLKGEGLYRKYQCVSCHSDNGRGLKTLDRLGHKYDIDSFAAYLRRPIAPMPIFPLSDMERRDLAVYMIGRYPGE